MRTTRRDLFRIFAALPLVRVAAVEAKPPKAPQKAPAPRQSPAPARDAVTLSGLLSVSMRGQEDRIDITNWGDAYRRYTLGSRRDEVTVEFYRCSENAFAILQALKPRKFILDLSKTCPEAKCEFAALMKSLDLSTPSGIMEATFVVTEGTITV